MNKARLIEHIAELVNDKKIDGISDLRDESDRDGHAHRHRAQARRDRRGRPQPALQAYRRCRIRSASIMLAIVDGKPKLLNLKEALKAFLDHRKEVVTRRTAYDLRKAEERLHILEGFKIALDNLDAVIALIRNRQDPRVAKEGLMIELWPERDPGAGDPGHASAAPDRSGARQDPGGAPRDASS